MSEPDSSERRRPPTIDLTATEVEAAARSDAAAKPEATAEPTKDRAADAPPRGASPGAFANARPYAIGVFGGAVAVAAILAGLWVAGVVPNAAAPSNTPPPAGQADKSADAAELSSRLDKIQQALQSPHTDDAQTARLTAAEAQNKSLGDQLAALTRRVDDVATATQGVAAPAKAAAEASAAAKNAAQAGVPRADLDALASRITELETAVKTLSAEVVNRTSTSTADDRVTRATVAAEALRAAVERGAPFRAELSAVQALGVDPNATAPLEPFAADGVPTAAALSRELTNLLPALQRAAEPASGGSFLARLKSHMQRLVQITPINAPSEPAADDVMSLVDRIDDDAERGDVAAALADLLRLPAAARAPADGWIKKAQARDAAITAARRIVTEALTALAKPVAQ
jgi:hypothetical protein